MRTTTLSLTIVTLLLSVSFTAFAQEGGNLDDAIKTPVSNIAKLEATVVPSSMQATHRENIDEQRIDLIGLLGQKKGEAESYLKSVSASLKSNQIEKLTQQITELDNQIASQKKALRGEVATDKTSTSAANSVATIGNRNGDGSGSQAVNDPNANGVSTTLAPTTSSSPAVSVPRASVAPTASSLPPAAVPAPGSAAVAAPPPASSTSLNCALVLQAPTSFSVREQQLCSLVRDVADEKLGNGLPAPFPSADLRLEGAEDYIVNIIAEAKTLGDVEDKRTDIQIGSDAQTKGTTSLVVKGGTPAVLSSAIENGAATATTSGTTINFRLNPLGIIHALNNTGYFTSYDISEKDPFTKFLRKTSFGVSFDASRGSQPGVFTGSTQQVSAFSARFEFVSDRDPRNKKYANKWQTLVDKNQIDYTNAAVKLRAALIEEAHLDPNQCQNPALVPPCPPKLIPARFKDPVLQKWLEETNTQLRAVQPVAGTLPTTVIEAVEKIIRPQIGLLSIDKIGGDTRNHIVSFAESLNSYLNAKTKLLDEIAKGKIMAFEYTNHREVNAPDTSSFNFIAEKGTIRRMDLTFNASLNMYNKKPAALNVKRIRDFVFAGQFDAPLTDISGVGQPIFSIAGRFERATGNAFALDGTVLPNTKGDVGSVQFKLLLPIKGTGIRLPFSVTIANRSELIREREVRTNFGFTFDLDRLLANNPFLKK